MSGPNIEQSNEDIDALPSNQSGNTIANLNITNSLQYITTGPVPKGSLGEFLSATVASTSAVSLSTTVVANVVSLVLTNGEWDVQGVIGYHAGSGTIPLDVGQGISVVSATIGPLGTYNYEKIAVTFTDDPLYSSPVVQVLVPGNSLTVYLVAESDFSVSTLTAYGFLRARRIH